ncbi:MAG: ATP-binding protein [Geovibrio sp.]|nr:ATP-binding protein [Geovibrio sp.]
MFFYENGRAVAEIEDNAGGIEEDLLERIFEPYFTTKPEGKGTGIGLYMSKMIVENSMPGRLYVRNTDKGACFRIELPSLQQ